MTQFDKLAEIKQFPVHLLNGMWIIKLQLTFTKAHGSVKFQYRITQSILASLKAFFAVCFAYHANAYRTLQQWRGGFECKSQLWSTHFSKLRCFKQAEWKESTIVKTKLRVGSFPCIIVRKCALQHAALRQNETGYLGVRLQSPATAGAILSRDELTNRLYHALRPAFLKSCTIPQLHSLCDNAFQSIWKAATTSERNKSLIKSFDGHLRSSLL